jgi:hypothetical protein
MQTVESAPPPLEHDAATRDALEELQRAVDDEADGLMAAGHNPTVRVLCKRLRKSPNLVSVALANWRRDLRQRINDGRIVPGLPPELIEWARFGYEVGKAKTRRAAASATPGDVERALREVISALEAQTKVLRAALAASEERIGGLETMQAEDRVRIAEFGRIEKRVQEKLGQAHRTIGSLRAELVAAQALARRARTTDRSSSRPRRAASGGRVASAKPPRVADLTSRTKRAARKQKPGRVAPARRGSAQRRVTSRGSKR